MNDTIFSSKIVSYTQWVIRWRWLVLLLSILSIAAVAAGARFISFSSNYRVYFGPDNPQLVAFDEIQATYSKDDNIIFVMAPDSGNALSPTVLSAVKQITESAWKLPYAIRVDSVSNYQHSHADGDNLLVEDLVDNPQSLTQTRQKEIRDIALSEPNLLHRLINEDASVTGVNVTFHLPEKSLTEVPEAVAAARALANEIRDTYPDIDIYMTGGVMVNNAFLEASQQDLSTLTPLMYIVILLTAFLFLRSVSGTVAILVMVTVATLVAMGTAGYLGIKLSPQSASAPTLIMTLAVADTIHIVLTLFYAMRDGMNKHDAIVESMRLNFMPVLITSVTTAIGFLSLNFSDSPPIYDMGNIAAIGVIAALIYAITLLPALMAVLPLKVRVRESKSGIFTERLGHLVVQYRKILLPGMMVVCAGLVALVPLNDPNDQFINYFDESITFRTDTEFTLANLTGVYQLHFSLDTDKQNGITNPQYLKDVQAFSEWFRQQPQVKHVRDITQTIKRLNRNMHEDDPNWYRIPESDELAAQYLLLYELSLPYGLDLTNQVNIDKSATLVSATVDNMKSREIRDLISRAEDWLDSNAPYLSTTGSGGVVMFAHISGRTIKSMSWGFIVSLIGISFLLILALRSVKVGLISLLPNLLPMGVAFGIWGWAVGEVGFTLMTVMGMTLGIVVDDSVHFLSKYLRAKREKGLSAEDSVIYAFRTVGGALLMTTVVLIAGFSVMATSAFLGNEGMGKLTVIAIASALIIDFLLLPPLLIAFEKRKTPEKSDTTEVQQYA